MTAHSFLRDDATFAQPDAGDLTGLTASAISGLTTSSISNNASYGDTNKTLTISDLPFVQLNTNLTAARTWTLPVSTTIATGSIFVFSDDGGINGANTLKFTIQGADLLIGVAVVANVLTLSNTRGSALFIVRSGAWHVIATT